MIQKTDDSIIGGILIVGGTTGMTFQSFIDSMELAMVFATITGNLILVISGIILMYPRLVARFKGKQRRKDDEK